MINYDPLQNQLSMGAYAGAMNPFASPYGYGALQTAMNPATFNPYAGVVQNGIGQQNYPGAQQGYAGVPNYGAIAQQQQQLQQLQQLQQQIATILASQGLASQGAIPQMFGMAPQGTPFQNPVVNPVINPVLAQHLALQAASQYAQPQYGQSWFGNPQAGQTGASYGQQPGFPQFGPLAPQSWVGQPGLFGAGQQQVPGQMLPHHLAHLAARGGY